MIQPRKRSHFTILLITVGIALGFSIFFPSSSPSYLAPLKPKSALSRQCRYFYLFRYFSFFNPSFFDRHADTVSAHNAVPYSQSQNLRTSRSKRDGVGGVSDDEWKKKVEKGAGIACTFEQPEGSVLQSQWTQRSSLAAYGWADFSPDWSKETRKLTALWAPVAGFLNDNGYPDAIKDWTYQRWGHLLPYTPPGSTGPPSVSSFPVLLRRVLPSLDHHDDAC